MLIDLSFRALFRSASTYRVTGQYEGVDLINGGKHRATDVGNFSQDDPILSPIDGMAMGLLHTDGAIGIDYPIGNGWHVQLWHLNATLAPLNTSVPVVKGQVCGRTGHTGVQPMPAHTHVELEREGIRFDIEPYLLGKPFETGGDDLEIPADTRRLGNRVGVIKGAIHSGVRIRNAPLTGETLATLMEERDYPYMAIGTVARNGGTWILAYLHPQGADKPPLIGWFHAQFTTPLVPDQEAVLR